MMIKCPTCQPPSRIKTWKRNIHVAMVGQIRLNAEVDIIPCAFVASLKSRGLRVIIAGQCEGHTRVSVLPIMMAHTTRTRGRVKAQRQ